MRYVHWCGICERREVQRCGDACGGCLGTLDALLDPIERPPLTMAPPRGVRVLRWVTRRWGLA